MAQKQPGAPTTEVPASAGPDTSRFADLYTNEFRVAGLTQVNPKTGETEALLVRGWSPSVNFITSGRMDKERDQSVSEQPKSLQGFAAQEWDRVMAVRKANREAKAAETAVKNVKDLAKSMTAEQKAALMAALS